jgi:hypothetical protein
MAVFTVVNCSLAGSDFYLDSTLVVIHLFVGRSLLPVAPVLVTRMSATLD